MTTPYWHPAQNKHRDQTGTAHILGDPDPTNTVRPLCGARPFSLGGGFAKAEDGGAHECPRCRSIWVRRAGK